MRSSIDEMLLLVLEMSYYYQRMVENANLYLENFMTSLLSRRKYVPMDSACFLMVRYADSLGKSTSDLTTMDMYNFSKWSQKRNAKKHKETTNVKP